MTIAHKIQFWLNDRRIETDAVPGTTTLLRYLRDHLHLTGTKEGCAEGDCGACTVVILEERPGASPTFRAVNSCLVFLPMLQGKRVYTVEGLRDRSTEGEQAYHPAQLALVRHRGSQCGYCTPGIAMSLFEATYRDDIDQPWKIDVQLCGNLCRCTGYLPIRAAGHEVAGSCPNDRFRTAQRQYKAHDAAVAIRAVNGLHGDQLYLQPADLPALFAARARHPEAPLVAGGTDLALTVTKQHRHYPVLIGLEAIPELRRLERIDGAWWIGAGVRLTRLMEVVAPHHPALFKMLRWFGSRQIRNRATVGGNLCTASPIGDLAPVLTALGATAVITGSDGENRIPLDDFFLDYRQTALTGDAILLAVELPDLLAGAFATSFKASKRRELDISIVAVWMYLELEEDRVKTLRLRYGGMAPRAAAPATRTEAALCGQRWSLAAVEQACASLDEDFTPISDHRGSAAYRARVAKNLLIGFYEAWREGRPFDDRPMGSALLGGVP